MRWIEVLAITNPYQLLQQKNYFGNRGLTEVSCNFCEHDRAWVDLGRTFTEGHSETDTQETFDWVLSTVKTYLGIFVIHTLSKMAEDLTYTY